MIVPTNDLLIRMITASPSRIINRTVRERQETVPSPSFRRL
jgi:hypothetical protein